jgi:hypothetical protein
MQDCNPVTTPIIEGLVITDEPIKNKNDSKEFTVEDYLSLIGSLQFLVTYTQLDISFTASFLACWNSKPILQYWKAAKRVLQYLKDSLDYSIMFNELDDYCLVAYSDTDWARDVGDCKSTSSFLIKIADSPIYWCSAKQTGISLSTTEAEYITASKTTKNVITTRGILEELGVIEKDFTFPMLVDNTGAITVSNSEKITHNTCHIDIHYHHIWDLVEKRIIKILHIDTNEMATNSFTKALGEIKFDEFQKLIGLMKSKSKGEEEGKEME